MRDRRAICEKQSAGSGLYGIVDGEIVMGYQCLLHRCRFIVSMRGKGLDIKKGCGGLMLLWRVESWSFTLFS